MKITTKITAGLHGRGQTLRGHHTRDVIDCVLSGAGAFGYWAKICFHGGPDDYTAAKQRLLDARGRDSILYYEDVLAEILEQGGPGGTPGKLTIYDREEDRDYELTMDKLLEGWRKYMDEYGRMDFEDYDGNDADLILQTALFGKQKYG